MSRDYEEAILLLDTQGRPGSRKGLIQARRHLESAIARRPKHAASHAALGYTNDHLGRRDEQALACFREAFRLAPRDRISEVYALTLLAEMGREKEALAGIKAAAKRHEVDLAKLRRELAAARFPADAGSLLMNGFIHARNFMRSAIADKAERIRDARAAGTRATASRGRAEGLPGRSEGARAPLRRVTGAGGDPCPRFLGLPLRRRRRRLPALSVDAVAEGPTREAHSRGRCACGPRSTRGSTAFRAGR